MTEHPEREAERLADELENEADKLEAHGEEVESDIAEARQDWDRKRGDDAVPGAQPPFEEETDFQDTENPARGPGGPAG